MSRLRSTTQAAAELGINPSAVRRMAATHEIGTKLGPRAWVFDDDDMARLRQRSTGKPGRPPKNKETGAQDNEPGGTEHDG